MAAWILVAANLVRHDIAAAIPHAELMLEPSQQPLPDPLRHVTAAAVDAWKSGDRDAAAAYLEDAARLAATTGHL